MKSKIILLSCLLALSFFGCKITLLPDYDQGIASQIESTLKKVDSFYLTMLETTKNENGERAYVNFVKDYIEIQIALQSLVDQNRVRPLNKNSTAIAENILEQFLKYKEKHKEDNGISDANIMLNRLYLHDHLVRLQMGESFKRNE